MRSRQLLNALNLLDEFGDEAGWEVDVVVDADSPFDPKTCRDFVRLVKAFRPYSHLHLKLADGPQDFLCLFANASGCVTDHRLGVYLSSVFDLDCRALKTSDNEQTFGEIDAFAAAIRKRLPADKRFEFAEQIKRLSSSARDCARMKTEKTAQKLSVDLKYVLISAHTVREALPTTGTGALALARAWDAVEKGDGDSAALQRACAEVLMRVRDELK